MRSVAPLIIVVVVLLIAAVATVSILMYKNSSGGSIGGYVDLSKLGKVVIGDFVVEYMTYVNITTVGTSYLAALYNANITEYDKIAKMGDHYFLSYSNGSTTLYGGTRSEKIVLITPSFSKVCERSYFWGEDTGWQCIEVNETLNVSKMFEEVMQKQTLLGNISLQYLQELENRYGQKLLNIVQTRKSCINNVQCACVEIDFKNLYSKLMESIYSYQRSSGSTAGMFKVNKAIYTLCYDETSGVILEMTTDMIVEGVDPNTGYFNVTFTANKRAISYKKTASIEDFSIPGLDLQLTVS